MKAGGMQMRGIIRPEGLGKAVLILLLLVGIEGVQAQDYPFRSGEVLDYTIRYKYGLVTMKGGTAHYHIKQEDYKGAQTFQSTLYFNTSSFFDKIYKIRDTLVSYASIPALQPLFHFRSVNEGDHHFLEEMNIKKHSDTYTEANIIRRRNGVVKIDTLLTTENAGYDLLNIFLFIRNWDYSQLSVGDTKSFSTFLGRRKASIYIRYQGKVVWERGGDLKYNALKFTIDTQDEVFTESSAALELWISDDKNRVPLRLKAKLKIGAAEADLSAYKNLNHPLTSEIMTPVKKQ